MHLNLRSPSPSQSTGVGMVASTQKGPVTRVMLFCCSGRSTKISSAGGSLLAIDLSVIWGTIPPTSSPFLFCLRLYVNPPAAPRLLSLQVVPGKRGGEKPLTSERQRNPARIDRDPAPAPLLGDVGGRTTTTSRVEHEIAGVGCQSEEAATAMSQWRRLKQQYLQCLLPRSDTASLNPPPMSVHTSAGM